MPDFDITVGYDLLVEGPCVKGEHWEWEVPEGVAWEPILFQVTFKASKVIKRRTLYLGVRDDENHMIFQLPGALYVDQGQFVSWRGFQVQSADSGYAVFPPRILLLPRWKLLSISPEPLDAGDQFGTRYMTARIYDASTVKPPEPTGPKMPYNYATEIAEANPGNRNFRLNDLAANAVKAICVSAKDRNSTDRLDTLKAVKVNDHLKVEDISNPNKWLEYRVTGNLTDNSTWVKFPITLVNQSQDPLLPMVAGEPVYIAFWTPSS
jgi:hypothetical protein